MHRIVRNWVIEVLEDHLNIVALAMRQRAKFEGWLKFELAACAEAHGASNVVVESGYDESRCRPDLAFVLDGEAVDVELKTANTNWRMDGVANKHRPITKNISSIVADAKKVKECKGHGIVAFVLFPVPHGDHRAFDKIRSVGAKVGVDLSEAEHCQRIPVLLADDGQCEALVCCFEVQK